MPAGHCTFLKAEERWWPQTRHGTRAGPVQGRKGGHSPFCAPVTHPHAGATPVAGEAKLTMGTALCL